MGGPVDQAGAEVGFQLAQGAGQRGLRHVQPGRGPGDGAFGRDGEEGAQMPQLHGHNHRA